MILYRAGWVLPVTAPPIRNGAVGVDVQGRISYVGPASDAPRLPVHDLGEAALLPGLVNAHTHLELTAMRGFLEDMTFFDWIHTLTRARREVLSDEDLACAARAGIHEGLASGVTTFADTCQSGVSLEAMRALDVRGVMYLEVFGPDPAGRDAALAGFRARLNSLRPGETDLVRLGVSPHAPYSVSAELFSAVGELALAERFPVAVHLAESEDETRFVRHADGPWADSHRRRGIATSARHVSPIAFVESTGLFRARPLLIHCVTASDDDIRIMRDAGCAVAHCPVSNAKLGHGIAPVTDFLAAGICVGLGSDSVASNNRMELLEEARTAVLAQRLRSRSPHALGAVRALELATIGGARALGIDDRVGSLECGKDADLAAFPLDTLRALPSFDPAHALVWAVAGTPASLVTVRGQVLVRDGRVLSDSGESRAQVREMAERLARWRAIQRQEVIHDHVGTGR